MYNYNNDTIIEEMEESLFADLSLPLIVWIGMVLVRLSWLN